MVSWLCMGGILHQETQWTVVVRAVQQPYSIKPHLRTKTAVCSPSTAFMFVCKVRAKNITCHEEGVRLVFANCWMAYHENFCSVVPSELE
jgi:hypothetical protein